MLPYSPLPGEHPNNSAAPEPQPRHSRLPMIIASVLALIILGGAAFVYYYFFLRIPPPSVSLEITSPDTAMLGERFKLVVSYANTSDQVLKGAVLVLNLPAGVSLLGEEDRRFSERQIGDVSGGRFGNATFELVATEGSQSVKRFDAKLRYGLETDPSHTSSQAARAEVAIGDPAVSVSMIAPQNISSGQDFNLVINLRNESKEISRNVKFSLTYPKDLLVKEATTSEGVVGAGVGAWTVAEFLPNATGTISLTGNSLGNEVSFSLPASLSLEIEGKSYVIWKDTQTITVAQAPLALTVLANDRADYVAQAGDTIHYSLRYKNTAAVALQNVVIRAELVSPLFLYSSLDSMGGEFSSLNHAIIWNSANTSALANVAPGQSGVVSFSVPIREELPIQRVSDRDFTLKVRAEIQSPTVPPGISAERTISIVNLVTKIAGDVEFSMPVYYYEPVSGFRNTGPFPPRVNKATQFTIHWRLRNGSTDMGNARIAARLGAGVKFLSVLKSDNISKPAYDAATGQVVWDIPRINATEGRLGAPLEAIFQVEITPAVNQVGAFIQLIGDASFTATDVFTGNSVRETQSGKTTSLPDDARAAGRGTVTP